MLKLEKVSHKSEFQDNWHVFQNIKSARFFVATLYDRVAGVGRGDLEAQSPSRGRLIDSELSKEISIL